MVVSLPDSESSLSEELDSLLLPESEDEPFGLVLIVSMVFSVIRQRER